MKPCNGQTYPITLSSPSKVGGMDSIDSTANYTRLQGPLVQDTFNSHLVGDM